MGLSPVFRARPRERRQGLVEIFAERTREAYVLLFLRRFCVLAESLVPSKDARPRKGSIASPACHTIQSPLADQSRTICPLSPSVPRLNPSMALTRVLRGHDRRCLRSDESSRC